MTEDRTPVFSRDADLELLLVWPDERPAMLRAGVVSLLLHLALGIGLLELPPIASPSSAVRPVTAELRRLTPLIAPPAELTQKAPNRGPISRELNLEGLRAQPRLEAPPTPPSVRRGPAPAAPQVAAAPRVTAAPMIPEPPKTEPERGENLQARSPAPAALGSPQAPPPVQIEPVEKPKLAFETPGAAFGNPRAAGTTGRGTLAPPKSSVDDAIRSVARRPGGGGLTVGDIGASDTGLGQGLNLPPNPGRVGSSLELLSDPMGVDFRPYLVQILAAVRRNWFAVIPESARLGRRGKVLIQFTISRDGNVPKLVITLPSGTEALDRAAVAGVSASNPFPPLPAEFRGQQIHLQFSFLYNAAPN